MCMCVYRLGGEERKGVRLWIAVWLDVGVGLACLFEYQNDLVKTCYVNFWMYTRTWSLQVMTLCLFLVTSTYYIDVILFMIFPECMNF